MFTIIQYEKLRLQSVYKQIWPIIGAILVSSQVAIGSEATSFFVGSKVGVAAFQDACVEAYDCEDNSTSYSIYGGYQYSENIGFELELINLGTVRSSTVTSESIGSVGSLKLGFPVNEHVSLYGKLGAGYLKNTKNATEEHDFNVVSALGVEIPINNSLSFLGEYQFWDGVGNSHTIGQADVHNFQVGFTYKFPSDNATKEISYDVKRSNLVEETRLYLGSLYFKYDSIDPEGFRQLENTLNRIPFDNDNIKRIDIVGYTDNRGNYKYNKRLSLKRAESVSEFFLNKGVDADKLNVSGRGEINPVVENSTDNGRAINRRVKVYLVK